MKKWKLYLYYNGVMIKKLKIREDEIPGDNTYSINVLFKKQLFNSNFVNICVKPTRILHNDIEGRKTYWGVVMEQGIEYRKE